MFCELSPDELTKLDYGGNKMPKQRITKEMVVNAAFEIARNDGME